MKLSIAAVTLAMLGSASAAQAEDVRFSGPWATLTGGYDSTELPNDDGPEIMTGFNGGFNFIRRNRVLGFEAEVGRSNADKSITGYRVPNDRIRVRYGTDFYFGVRPGLRLARPFLFYGKAGVATTGLHVTYSGGPPLQYDVGKFGRPGRLIGFLFGGGGELRMSNQLIVKVEYRYANFHDGIYRHQAVVGLGFGF